MSKVVKTPSQFERKKRTSLPLEWLQRCEASGALCEGGGERDPFVEPAGDTADHHLHRQPKPSEAQRGFVGTVAVRPGAIDHEQFVFRKLCHPRRGHLAVRDVDGSLDVSICERSRSTDVD